MSISMPVSHKQFTLTSTIGGRQLLINGGTTWGRFRLILICPAPPHLPMQEPGTPCTGGGADVERGPRRRPLRASSGHGRVHDQAKCGVWLTAQSRGRRVTRPSTQGTPRGYPCLRAP